MIKHFCDLCKKEINDETLSEIHSFGEFEYKDIITYIKMQFNGELCYKCRMEVRKIMVDNIGSIDVKGHAFRD